MDRAPESLPASASLAASAPARVALRLDPWAAEYEGSIQITDDARGEAVDTTVESPKWVARSPAAAGAVPTLAFVDGVRRLEHRLLIGAGERTVFGLLGAFGAGAALAGEKASVAHQVVSRVIVAGDGLLLPPFEAPLTHGGGTLVFEPRAVAPNAPEAAVLGLQEAMREAEGRLAGTVEADVVFQDGPLSYVSAHVAAPVVGFVKRLQQQYLDAERHALLPRLAVGERTPLFLIGGRESRYSWYQRIAFGRATQAALTGVVRLECRVGCGLERARALADTAARELPRFASDGTRDPRAPQNLFPIGGLEARLKHLLGDPAVVRRAIEARIHCEVSA